MHGTKKSYDINYHSFLLSGRRDSNADDPDLRTCVKSGCQHPDLRPRRNVRARDTAVVFPDKIYGSFSGKILDLPFKYYCFRT